VSEQDHTQDPPAPQSSEPVGPTPDAPRRAPQQATTTDLGRFPERSETGEITTFLAADAPAQDARATANAARPAQPIGSSDGEPGLPLNIDPQIEIVRRISAGGMGEVFLGRQKHLGRNVAVKRIRDWGADAATKERFIHEAKAQSRLQHPGIAQVHDLRESGGELYLIMEYVEGRTLEEVLAKEGKFSPDRIVPVGVQLTEALEAAAHEGYIHRDLKPGNVMLTWDGKVKIIDFGLALLVRNLKQTRFTEKGEVLGTPAFMSPEQLNQEENLDIRSDIWSLGVLLYTLATAETPFIGKDFVCTVKNVMMAEPVPLPTLEPGFPPGLWEAIAHALRKNRAERWQDYAAFRAALLNGGDSRLGLATNSDSRSSGGPRRRSRRPAAVLLGLVLLALGVVAAAELFSGPPVPSSTEKAPKREETAKPEPDSTRKILAPADAPLSGLGEKEASPPASAEPPSKPMPLREKLAGYALTKAEASLAGDLLDLFSRHRPQLMAKEFGTVLPELEAFEKTRLGLSREERPSPEKEYAASQVRGATSMVRLAAGAMVSRLEALRHSRESVTLVLNDGKEQRGSVRSVDKGFVTLTLASGGDLRIALESIRPESLKGQTAPATAYLALLSLTGNPEASLPDIVDLADSRDDLLFWIPVALRLARLEVEAVASAAATELKKGNETPEQKRVADRLIARVESLAEILAARKDFVTRLFCYAKPEFELVERESRALKLLKEDAHSGVLALGGGTAAFPVAAEALLSRFKGRLESEHDELQAGSGWHGFSWQLFPPEPSVKEALKYWNPDGEGHGTILQAADVERRISMGRGAKRAAEGLVARLGFDPDARARHAAHWRLLLRSKEGAPHYLRFDDRSCGLFRTRLEAGEADRQIATAQLPGSSKSGAERELALLPVEGSLHVMLDGRHVLAVPEAEAVIPMQLSIAVTQGTLAIRSIKVMKSPSEENQ
jgi:serine/threonine protein kinase